MTKNESNQGLSVADRVRAALKLKQHESPGVPPTISEICRLAGVNRANLYARYPALIEQLNNKRKTNFKAGAAGELLKANSRVRDNTEKKIELRNKALLYLCLEMKAQIVEIEMRSKKVKPANEKLNRAR